MPSTPFSVRLQYIMPQHGLSRLAGWFGNNQNPRIKNGCISYFLSRYTVNLAEVVQPDPYQYPTYNAFFTRQLKPEVRPITADQNAIAAPVDGTVYQVGEIEDGRMLQAKGRYYSLLELVGGDADIAAKFESGKFLTTYLAPHDYHRVHIPFAGQLQKMLYIPGKLFSVNPQTTEGIPRLFARNERVVCEFNTTLGPMAVIFVGAMLVGSIQTIWNDPITLNRKNGIGIWDCSQITDPKFNLAKGQEIGHFQMGSTVIILFPKNTIVWDEEIVAGKTIRYGEKIGSYS